MKGESGLISSVWTAIWRTVDGVEEDEWEGRKEGSQHWEQKDETFIKAYEHKLLDSETDVWSSCHAYFLLPLACCFSSICFSSICFNKSGITASPLSSFLWPYMLWCGMSTAITTPFTEPQPSFSEMAYLFFQTWKQKNKGNMIPITWIEIPILLKR